MEKTIVAVELGSSKISGVAGYVRPDGSLEVQAYAWTPVESCVRHGAVYNLDRTANAIATVISHLDGMLDSDIERVYVGYNARTLRTVPGSVESKFDEETVIDAETVDRMYSSDETLDSNEYVTLAHEAQEYVIDSRQSTETDPIGVACRSIRCNYMDVVISRPVAEFMAQCFADAHIEILDGFVSPIAQAHIALTEEDRQQGCALVDYGADTTTVSVYKNGLLRYLRVIPFGSALITKDLAAILGIERDHAELLKRTYGLCNMTKTVDTAQTIGISGRQHTIEEIGEIIGARNEEIVRNVVARINDSGYADKLGAGIVLTGGGSRLSGLQMVFEALMPNASRLRFATEPVVEVDWAEPSWNKNDGSQMGLLAVMSMGNENCCQEVEEEPEKMDAIDYITPEQQGNMGMNSLFTDDGENAQALRDQEEQEQARQRKLQEQQMSEQEEQKAETPKKRQSGFLKLLQRVIEKSENYLEGN
ncbi:MAG: cell division protein FtsA [Bacteroidaceae bacterium]|nr:cell division protein FtsA [Bacteroidaceae bacterium]